MVKSICRSIAGSAVTIAMLLRAKAIENEEKLDDMQKEIESLRIRIIDLRKEVNP